MDCGETHVGELATQHLLDVAQHPGIAAQNAMLAADPQVAGFADRFGGRLGRIIRVPIEIGADLQQFVELVLIEAGQFEWKLNIAELAQLK